MRHVGRTTETHLRCLNRASGFPPFASQYARKRTWFSCTRYSSYYTVFSAAARRLAISCGMTCTSVEHPSGADWPSKSATLPPYLTPRSPVHSSPAKSPVKYPPSAYFRVVWQSPAACKLLKVHLIGGMAWKRSSVRSRSGPPINQ